MTKDVLLARIDELLNLTVPDSYRESDYTAERVLEMYQGALQLVRIVHGRDSAQEASLVEAYGSLKNNRGGSALHYAVQPVVIGTLKALRAEIDAGLLGSAAMRGAGEALADFLSLARDALATGTDGGRNIAAVLTAALYEDTMRRLGATLGGVDGRPGLHEVVNALKAAGVLQGASHTVAQSYLKFRNDALHADWGAITPATIESCLAYVQGLLLQHFS